MVSIVRFTLAVVIGAVGIVSGQNTSAFEGSVRAAMAPSLEKQRQSVQKQAMAAAAYTADVPPSAFFTIPFPTPIAMPPGLESYNCDPLPATELSELVKGASEREDVNSELLFAVIKEESGGRACAVSAKGAQGLMQIMPETAAELAVADPFDPKQNVDAGAKFLKTLLTRYKGDLSLALSAYNAGTNRVDKDKGIPQIPETTSYVADILSMLSHNKESGSRSKLESETRDETRAPQ